jgi:carbonic anhydrase
MTIPVWKKNLVEGYQSFRAGSFVGQKELYSKLGQKGQNPEVMIIACSDSRADPSDIFDTYPGEIFTMRNVANIVPPFEDNHSYHGSSAAIEFAVKHLKVKAIIVMGHEDCGGIKAHLSGFSKKEPESFIGKWISILDNVKTRVEHDECEQHNMELTGVMNSIENLMSFPFVRSAVEEGDLELMGAYFSIIQGKLLFADKNGNFEEVPAQ